MTAACDNRNFAGTAAWPWRLISVFGALSLALAAVIWSSTAAHTLSQGGVLYPLDDTYIHLAVARTFATTGIWGVTPAYPAAASSSPLWTAVLAALSKAAPWMDREALSWAPLLVNVATAYGLLAFWIKRLAQTRWPGATTLILALIVPVPAIAMIGMEHLLHALLASMFAWRAAAALDQENQPDRRRLAELALMAALSTAARYESLALVAAVALIAVSRRRWRLASSVAAAALVPVLLCAALWTAHGGWPLPNALLLKGMASAGGGVFGPLPGPLANLLVNVMAKQAAPVSRLLIILAVLIVGLVTALGQRHRLERTFGVLAALSTLAQVSLGSLNLLYRYEAWIVALDGLAIVLLANRLFQNRPAVLAGVLGCMALACAPRAWASLSLTHEAAHDREWEHFGPQRAIKSLGAQPVLVNDLGVIGYYGSGPPIDIYGLGNNEALRLRRGGRETGEAVQALALRNGAHIGVIQLCWPEASRRLPPAWRAVEIWQGPRNVPFGDLTVGFLADSEASAAQLERAIGAADTPAGVTRMGLHSDAVRAYNQQPDRLKAALLVCRQEPGR